MAILLKEYRPGSGRDGDSNSRKLVYLATAVDPNKEDETEATALTKALDGPLVAGSDTIATTYDGLVIDTPTTKVTELSVNHWLITVPYRLFKPRPSEGEVTYQFSLGGESVNVQEALATQRYAAGGATPADDGNAINVDANGQVNGLAINAPTAEFQIGLKVPALKLTAAYRKLLKRLRWHVNSVVMFVDGEVYQPGELQFAGAVGRKNSDGTGELSLSFREAENEVNLTVGGISVTEKKGHHYLWPKYEEAEDTAAKKRVSRVHTVNVQQVYKESDLRVIFAV